MQASTSLSGIHLHYAAICHRKLWLFDRGITMERESDRVTEGALLHEKAYRHLEKKEVLIDNAFKIDAVDGDYVREVKLSSRMNKADELQMLFYLKQLRLRGVDKKGLISYTKEKRTEEVILTDKNEALLNKEIALAYETLNRQKPPRLKRLPYCAKCAYYSFCFAIEEDD